MDREKRFLSNLAKKFNPVLFSQLEEKDTIAVYIAVKSTVEYHSLKISGRPKEEAERKWIGKGLDEMVGKIRSQEDKDPKTIFFLLVEIYSRLLTETEFREFFENLLQKDIPSDIPDLLDIIIFNNPKLSFEFRNQVSEI